jgi:hypothetical protein
MTPHRLRSIAAGAIVALVIASQAHATAPGDQYGIFDMNDLYITDTKTGLVWQRHASTTAVSFADAALVCSSLSLQPGELSGWRVPSYKELLTIVDEEPQSEYDSGQLVPKAIDTNAFPRTQVDASYWTSSVYPVGSGRAYAVNFSDGVPTDEYQTGLFHVRCVHD